jgi:hypothetical protein
VIFPTRINLHSQPNPEGVAADRYPGTFTVPIESLYPWIRTSDPVFLDPAYATKDFSGAVQRFMSGEDGVDEDGFRFNA